MIKASRSYYINAQNRLSGTPSSFTYKIDIPKAGGITYERVVLMQANIPSSYYIVSATGNTFILKEGNTSVTITVPESNYNSESFATVVKELMNAFSPHQYTYDIIFPDSFSTGNSGKYTFTSTGDDSALVMINELYEQFGFQGNGTYPFVSRKLISNAVVKFVPEDTIYIHSDIVENEQQAILQDLYNHNSNTFSNLVFICPDPIAYSKVLRTNESNVFHFSLTNEHNKELQLNGLCPAFTIMLFSLDQSIVEFTEIFKNYIKYNLLSQ